jgi:hypothetical protein
MECQRQFHFEVLKKLHSMKSGKNLVDCQDVERPSYEESNTHELDLEHSKQFSNLESELECREMKIGSEVDNDLNEDTAENLMIKLSKILRRNQELEDALNIKDTAIKKLLARNAELENELKRKEAMRLSQLELLSLRNVELERELHQARKSDASRPDDVAWF